MNIDFDRWPEDFAERYRRAGYWCGERLGDIGRDHRKNCPDRIAIVEKDRRLTYGELNDRADRFAGGLLALGLKPNDRLVIQLPNILEFAIATLGMFRAGVVPVFALPAHRAHEITYLCETSEAVAYLCADEYAGFDYRSLARQAMDAIPTLRHAIVVGAPAGLTAFETVDAPLRTEIATDPEDVAFFLLSGGTTGLPKLIPRTHDDYAYQLRRTAEVLDFDRNGIYLACVSVSHNAAFGCPGLLGTLREGGKVLLPRTPSPDDVFPLIMREGVTLTTLMPPLVLIWLEVIEDYPIDLSGMILQVGSARFAPELAKRVTNELGCRLSHWFGMAEGLLTCTRLDDPQDVVETTQGRAICPDDELMVVDEEGEPVPAGDIGELITRGPYTLRGYYKAAAHNAIAFTEDGFLRTGDLVRITSDGNLVVEGRIKDVINRGGEKIVASEIEDALTTHPGIREVALVALPDTTMGEKSCVCIVAREPAPTLQQIKDFLRDRGFATYKLPDMIHVLDTMPRTSAGKLNKAELRKRYAG